MRLFVLVRHGQSELNVTHRVNGDPSVPVGLTEQGEAEAGGAPPAAGGDRARPLRAHALRAQPRDGEDRARGTRRCRSRSSRCSTTSTSASSRAGRSTSTGPGRAEHTRARRLSGRREPGRLRPAVRRRLRAPAGATGAADPRRLPRDPRPLRDQRRSRLGRARRARRTRSATASRTSSTRTASRGRSNGSASSPKSRKRQRRPSTERAGSEATLQGSSRVRNLLPQIPNLRKQMAPGGIEPPRAGSKPAALSTELRGRPAASMPQQSRYPVSHEVAVAQLVELRVVVPVVAGSSPVRHLYLQK